MLPWLGKIGAARRSHERNSHSTAQRKGAVLILEKDGAAPRHFSREFTLTSESALAHRFRAPRLPQTAALHGLLRRSEPPPPQLLRAAASEGMLDAVDRATMTALHLAAQRGLDAAVHALLLLGSRVDFTDGEGEAALCKVRSVCGRRCHCLW